MIVLEEVATKLAKILNKQDDEVNADLIPFDYSFNVQTQGFHLDSIAEQKEGVNAIPVFCSFVGGQNDPVPNLERGTFNVRVDMYFPVAFKKNFYVLNDSLAKIFVAKFLNFGENSGKCLCNVSPNEAGEIQDFDVKQFKEWVGNTFKKDIDATEKWMSIHFTLYLTHSKEEFVYGNNVELGLTMEFKEQALAIHVTPVTPGILPPPDYAYRNPSLDVNMSQAIVPVYYYAYSDYENDKTYYVTVPFESIDNYTPLYEKEGEGDTIVASSRYLDGKNAEKERMIHEQLVWTDCGTGYSNNPVSQQLVNNTDKFVKNSVNISNYNKSFIAYFRDNEFWNHFLEEYNNNKVALFKYIYFTKKYKISKTKEYVKRQEILSINENIPIGDLLSYTFTLGD